jgi:hypothetical protein
MRRILPVVVLVSLCIGFGCERAPERPGVFEPAFAKTDVPPNPCPTVIGTAAVDGFTLKYEIVVGLYEGIDALFQDMRSKNGARSHVDNIVREVCAGDYAGALDFVHGFIQQIEGQPDDMLSPDQPSVAELVTWAQVLARPMAPDALPEGVLAADGVLALTPGGISADAVRTRNGHVIVNASDFPAGAPFVVAIAPGPGNYGDYVVYLGTDGPESYQITTDRPDRSDLAAPVLIVFCGSFPTNLNIAHDKGSAGVELLPTEPVDCATFGASQSSVFEGAPAWLRTLAQSAGAAARKMFGPAPVYARELSGLGGRTKSFSPFALVRPGAPRKPG